MIWMHIDRVFTESAWGRLSEGDDDASRALRRRVVFNLLAIDNALVGQSGQGRRAVRQDLAEFAPKLSEGALPWSTFLAFSYQQNQELEQAIKWTRYALNDSRFTQDRYPLDQAGTEGRIAFQLYRYLKQQGDVEGAGRALGTAGKRLPDDPEIQEARCAELLRDKEPLPALRCIERYMEIRPTFVQGHFIKAQLLEALGRYAEAISSVEEGLSFPTESFCRETKP